MRCPNCGAEVPAGTAACPACHYDLGLTQRIPVTKVAWCPSCGALVPPDAHSCPKCGAPVGAPARSRSGHAVRDLAIPTIEGPGDSEGADADEGGADATRAMPRIESAIPSEPGPESATVRHDRMPRTRVLMVAAAAAIALAGGMALWITHPWDPNLYITHSQTDADTSMAGYPGYLSALTGQDGSSSATDTSSDSSTDGSDSSSSTAYQAILDDYNKLGTYADQLDQSVSDLTSTGVSGTAAERQDGQSTAEQTAIDISNLIDDIASLNDGDGTYANDIANLTTLGNWLRNRSDAICEAWDSSVTMATEEKILAPLKKIGYSSGTDNYKTLFEENYDAWKPVEQ
jgi:RNA polymerase subunit RPABC4/transcription elongation factor Spt4